MLRLPEILLIHFLELALVQPFNSNIVLFRTAAQIKASAQKLCTSTKSCAILLLLITKALLNNMLFLDEKSLASESQE